MNTFLDRIAEIINRSEVTETNICVVFPNRRAGTFLRRKLIPDGNAPRWLPAILSIEDFVFGVSKLKEPDSVSQLTLLYKAHCTTAESAVTFDNFLSWGSEVLKDFEETDQYMADAESLFSNLSEARETETWKPGEEMSDFEKNYVNFYKSLAGHYKAYKEILTERGLAFQGMATRMLAGSMDEYAKTLPWQKIIFAGFNALTPAQLTMIRHLVGIGVAEVIFDADAWYLNDPAMEAGNFLRKHQSDKQLGEFREISDGIADPLKKIYTCGITGKIGQARIAGSILDSLPEDKYSSTAVVLADESLLIPVLNALPSHQGNFNVTMGFPLSQAPAFTLADSILQLHVSAQNPASANPSFYHADVTSVLQDSNLHRILLPDTAQAVITGIKKDNYAFITLPEIKKLAGNHPAEADAILERLFVGHKEPTGLLDTLLYILEKISTKIQEDDDTGTENEILFTLYQKVAGLRVSLQKENIHIESLLTLYHFFREAVAGARVPFYGEPLKGIQIMGMLETRVLDFENIILLSANEDMLPSAKTNRSFIPADIRRYFGLPTHNERQAVFAYHFYHLLQRCSNAWLIYNQDGDSLGGGEMSRYIRQLIWEFPKRGLKVHQLNTKEVKPVSRSLAISIPKTEEIMQRLYEKAEKGFSFSSLKQYINCGLSFYFAYVLKLEEIEEVEEEISSRTMGTILHGILEDLYRPSIGSFPDENTLTQAIENAERIIKKKAEDSFPALKINSGKNLLFLKVAETWLRRYLRAELETLKSGSAPELAGIEHELERDIFIDTDTKQALKVRLYAKIDRLDITAGALRVIDYKTGSVSGSDVTVKAAQDLFNQKKKFEKPLQLTFYKYITESKPEFDRFNIVPGILSFKALGKGFMPLNSCITDADFETELYRLFQEIFNTNVNFEQTDINHCKFCNFKAICNRISPEW